MDYFVFTIQPGISLQKINLKRKQFKNLKTFFFTIE